MRSSHSRFRSVLNRVLSSGNAAAEQPTLTDRQGIRNFVRQSMEARFVTLTLKPEWAGGGTSADLQWQTEGTDSFAALPARFEEQADGSFDLLLEDWPNELEPLVLLTGRPSFTEFPEQRGTFFDTKSIRPSMPGTGRLAAASTSALQADSDDLDQDDDPEPLRWDDDGQLHICLRLPNISEPFLAVVEMTWKLESGQEKTVPTTVLMTQEVVPGLWSSSLTLERPDVTRNGRVVLKLRPLQESDLRRLPTDWTDHSQSMVQQFLVKQKFRTRPVVNIEGTEDSKPRKRLRGVDRAAVNTKTTHLHLLVAPAGGKTSPSHSAGTTFHKTEVEAELKALRAGWNDSRFADLWLRISPRLSGLLAGKGMDQSLIEDHLQEAFLVLRNCQLQTEDDENLVSYVMTAVVNKATDYYRRKKNHLNRGVGYGGDDAADPTADLPDEEDESVQMGMCQVYLPQIVHLTDVEQSVLNCTYVKNLTVAEIAEQMGLPENKREHVRRLQEKINLKLNILAGLHLLRPQDTIKSHGLIENAESPAPTPAGVQDSEHMISQLEYDIVFHQEIRELSEADVERLLNLHPNERRDLLESTMQKVHAASAAISLAYDGHISHDELDLLEEWLFRDRTTEQLSRESAIHGPSPEPELLRLGLMLHGQILIMTDGKRGPLYKAGCEFIEHRIIRERSNVETTQRLIDCRVCEPRKNKKGELTPPVVALDEVPFHVANIWSKTETLVPRPFCQLHLPEIADRDAILR